MYMTIECKDIMCYLSFCTGYPHWIQYSKQLKNISDPLNINVDVNVHSM